MGILQTLWGKIAQKKKTKDDYEWEQEVEENYYRRKMNPYEREYLKYKEEARQERIKQIVKQIRKKKMHDLWSGKNFNAIHTSDVINRQPNIFQDNHNIFPAKDSLLGGENLFVRKW